MKIMIADNAQEIVNLLKEVLMGKRHSVDVAYDGKQALELLKVGDYEIVFLDHDMPEMTGIELVKYIRANELTCKIVMISGYPAMEEFFVKAIGADDYMPKPFTLDQIIAVIEKYEKK